MKPAPKKKAPVAKRAVDVKRGRATTWRTNGQETANHERVLPAVKRVVPDVHAKVGVGGSSKVGQENFSSVEVRVWCELPCAPDEKSIKAAYKEASDYVERWIQRELDLAMPDRVEEDDDLDGDE